MSTGLSTIQSSPWIRSLLAVPLLLGTARLDAAGWPPGRDAERRALAANLVHVRRLAYPPGDGPPVTAHLVLFGSRAFRLAVVDLGPGADPEHPRPSLPAALRAAGCVAGVNGGFFHPDGRPLGLVIAGGRRINRLETAQLLGGVVYGDDRGIHLLRRSRFQDHPGIDALVQTGPYLVEGGRAVRGLSGGDPARRTFIATDWRGRWALGVSLTPLSLAALADGLATPGALIDWPVERAINLDGGSSSGFYADLGAGRAPVVVRPWKPVRNLLGIAPR